MKIDLVIPFFRQEKFWPLVAHGILANADCINRVILVNDEPWIDPRRTAIEIGVKGLTGFPPLVFLDHARNDFGAHRCIRQGAAAVETEWWTHIDGDIILAPGALAKISSEPERGLMLCGLAHDVEDDITLDLLTPTPPIERRDRREGMTTAGWQEARDLFIFSSREDYFEMGGHDIAYPGYGCLDYDVAMRWLMHFGPDSIEICNTAVAYHLGGTTAHHATHPGNVPLFNAIHTRFNAWSEAQ